MNTSIAADDFRMAGHAREFETRRVVQGALIAAGTAVCLNVIVYLVARALGVTFTGRFNPASAQMVVGLKDVVGASIVWLVPASLGLLAMNRFAERPARMFAISATAFGLLSIAGPLTFPEASAGTKIALSVMHVVLTVAIVWALVLRERSGRA